MVTLNSNDKNYVIVARNNDAVFVLSYTNTDDL